MDYARQGWISPRAAARVGRWGERWAVVAIGRTIDRERYAPVAPHLPSTWYGTVAGQWWWDDSLSLFWSGTVRFERLPFRGAPALLNAPGEQVDEIVRGVGTSDLLLLKDFGRRWSGSLGWRLNGAPTADPARTASPEAPWVAGYLEPYRRHVFSGSLWWELPTDPSPLTIGGFFRSASPVRGESTPSEWWLDRTTTTGVVLSQQISVRKGLLAVGGSYVWSKNELGANFLVPEAWALLGDRVGPAVEPHGRADVRVSYTF